MNLIYRNITLKNLFVCLFFGLLLLLGLLVYDDYGVSWDEQTNQMNGVISAVYVSKLLFPGLIKSASTLSYFPELHQYLDKDYGIFFEIFAFGLERALHLSDVKSLYLMRHLLTFAFFYAGVISFYKLIANRSGNWKLGLLGAIFLVLSPRIFADAFYNSKDLVFMSLFCISVYTMVEFLKSPAYKTAFFHALATAAAIDVRITGVCIPALTMAVWAINYYGPHEFRFSGKRYLLPGLLYLVLTASFTFLLWPFLWENPLGNFALALKNMSLFRWDNNVLYLGKFVRASQIPWHYFPVWLFITTPLFYSFLFVAGLIFILRNWLKHFRDSFRPGTLQEDLLFTVLFFGPALSVIVLHSILYDGWRQLYFLYIPFLYLALRGFSEIWFRVKGRRIAWVFILLTGIHTADTTYSMVRNHPFQYGYFSFLRGTAIEKNFERDYWGVSVRRGLEYILETDPRPVIKVSIHEDFLVQINNNTLLLTPEQRKRLVRVKPYQNPDYYIVTYRLQQKEPPHRKPYFSVIVQGAKLMSVFKLR